MAFPSSTVYDDLTGSDLNPINSTGIYGAFVRSAYSGNCQRVSNQGAASSGAGSVSYTQSLSRASNAVEVEGTARPTSSTYDGYDRFIGGLFSDLGAGLDGYYLVYSDGDIILRRVDNGSDTDLGSFANAGLATGDRIGMLLLPSANGSTIEVYLNGSLSLSVADATYTSGVAGWGSENADTRWDDIYWAEVTPPEPPLITFVAAGTGSGSASDASPGMPSGATTGDLLILVVEGEGEDPSDDSVPTGGDWTLVDSVASSTDGTTDRTRCTVGWAWYDAGLNLTVPDAGSRTITRIYAFRGADPTTPIEAFTTGSSSTNATSHTASTGLSTLTNEALVALCFTHGDDGVVVSSPAAAALTGVGNAGEFSSAAGTDGTVGLIYGTKTAAGAVGDVTWSIGVSEERAWIALAVKPATSGTSGTASATLTLTATASGTPTTPGTAAKALTLTATANGTRTVLGSAAKTLTLTATAAGAPTRTGTAAASLTLTAAASGTPTHPGVAAQALTLTATANGTRTVAGSAAKSLTLTATATGVKTVSGSASQALTLSATASGSVSAAGGGTASQALTLTATATGTRTTAGTAAKTLTLTATASGTRTVTAAASKTLTLTATATALRTVLGTASKSLSLTATALGTIEAGGDFTQPYLRLSGTPTRKPFKHKPGGTVTEGQLYLKPGGTVGPLV